MSKILSINAGSSSLKFKFIEMPNEKTLCEGIVERIGSEEATIKFKSDSINDKRTLSILNHEVAVDLVINGLLSHGIIKDLREITGIGHRVVHGGEMFSDSVLIDEQVMEGIHKLSDLAPLHNPANLTGIKSFKKVLPDVPSVAVFDTAFHQTLDEEAFIYGAPYEWYEKYGVRKYGFHGTSHKYVSSRVSEILGKKEAKIIVCHLGNGGSLCAVKDGKSVDTTMGFTPISGLIMGTRCGDIDAAVIPYIVNKTNKNIKEVENELNKQSGLLGISGVSNDSRDIEDGIAKGDKRCILAHNIFIRRIASYIASYHVLLGGADAIAFTAGIGENSAKTREDIIARLAPIGVKMDKEANNCRGVEKLISNGDSSIKCFVIPTNEEIMIARDVTRLINRGE